MKAVGDLRCGDRVFTQYQDKHSKRWHSEYRVEIIVFNLDICFALDTASNAFAVLRLTRYHYALV